MTARAQWMPELDLEPDECIAPPAEPGTIRYAASRGRLMLIEAIAARHMVTVGEVLQPSFTKGSRKPDVCRAREEVYYELVQLGMNWSEVARVTGRDRSTVQTGYRNHERRVAK